MLKMKTEHPIEEVNIVNFISSIPGETRELSSYYIDPVTRRKITITSCIPRLEDLDGEHTILLLEELQCHLKYHLWKKNRNCRHTEEGRISEEQRRDTTYLINHVQKSLKVMLRQAVGTSFLVATDFLFRPNDVRLDDPEALLMHWYCNNCFPDETDFFVVDTLEKYLQKQLAKLEEQLAQLQEDESTSATVKPREFLNFRCEIKHKQLELIAELKKPDIVLAADELPPEDHCEKEKSIVSKYGPQWYRMPELVNQIEQMRLYQASKESYSGLEEKYDAWLKELNRRIEGLLPHSAVSNKTSDEKYGCRKQIRFLNSFVNGGDLERTEELLYCWYLNERFPFSMDLEKMYRIEKELKRQLSALDEEEERYNERGESDLWLLRYHLRENQLDEIQERICSCESLVPTISAFSDLWKELD